MEQERRIMVRVPEQLHKAVRVRAAEEGRHVSGIVRALLRAWLEGMVNLEEVEDSLQEEDPTT